MNPGIFLIQGNEELVEMNEQEYDSEKMLQTWLAKYPELLVGNQIDSKEPRRFLLIQQECGVPGTDSGSDRWKIDHLFLDQEAIPTMVEIKRSSDTRVRREVVGQMLDYAANATKYWPVSKMREAFMAHCGQAGIDAEQELAQFLVDEIDVEEFWQTAEANLRERRLRLVFVADRIPSELQSIVEFLNEQMDHTEVLAIEIKHYVSDHKVRGLVPRVIGQTAKAREVKSFRTRTDITEEEFFEVLEARSAKEARVAHRILDWSHELFTSIEWQTKSFVPKLDYGGDFTHNPITVFGVGKIPRVGVKFRRMKYRNGFSDKQLRELLRRLNEIPGVSLKQNALQGHPMIPLAILAKDESLERFLAIIEWTVDQVKRNA